MGAGLRPRYPFTRQTLFQGLSRCHERAVVWGGQRAPGLGDRDTNDALEQQEAGTDLLRMRSTR